MTATELEGCSLESAAPEMAMTAAVLEERVNNHIKAFIWAILLILGWLSAISVELYRMNGTMNRVEKAQVDAPARIIAGLLKRTSHTRDEMADALGAASTILRTTKIGNVKPSPEALKDLSSELQNVQENYPDLPSVWQTTGQFINYKSTALLPASAESSVNSARTLDCRGGSIETFRGIAFVKKCTLTLENAVAADNVVFENCVIRYKGGPIPIKHAEFKDCIFQFDITNVPSREALIAIKQITASVSQDFKLTVS